MIYTHNNYICCRRDKPASDCKDTNNLSVIQTFRLLFQFIYDYLINRS